MPAIIAETRRENLYKEIIKELDQWPELERKVFSEAHYHGQSPESISRSFQLDEEKVSAILKQCDHRLHASLRNLCVSCHEKSILLSSNPASPASGRPDMKAGPTISKIA